MCSMQAKKGRFQEKANSMSDIVSSKNDKIASINKNQFSRLETKP